MGKTDLMLQKDVADELALEPSVDSARIGVAAGDGVVTLTGTVNTYAEKTAAEQAAKRVAGVKGLASEIDVDLAAFHERSDTEIAAAALNVLAWEVTVPEDTVTVEVEDGWLTLEGRVDWRFQRENAEGAVQNLTGVRGITNRIAVQPHVRGSNVEKTIREKFERTADIDASRIRVETHDGTVTLRGSVRSFAEREDAARAAYAVPGVSQVENLITVSVP
ncbi:MAG TPA: BON domain-containing protein [Candidatus Limnocylindria bacterium]|jgi:osmotically-inducible protein OsmY|nr:BON domain-containing protein [Candidatus Limnocylindria bacterium]